MMREVSFMVMWLAVFTIFNVFGAAAVDASRNEQTLSDIFELIIRSNESNLLEIGALVRENPEVLDYEDAFGNTLIPLLVKNRAAVNYVTGLINLGAFKDQVDLNHFTPLHHAVKNGDLPMVSYLLSIGVDLNSRANVRNLRNTPLHIASSSINESSLEIMRLLIEQGANCHDVNTELDSPLHLAVFSNCPDHVDLLIQHGVRLNSPNCLGQTPLHVAVLVDSPEIVDRLLVAGANPNRTDNHFNSPLYEAAESLGSNTLAIINRLLAGGARTDLFNAQGESFFEVLSHFNSLLTDFVQVRPDQNPVEELALLQRPRMQIDSTIPSLPVVSFENSGVIFTRPNLRTIALSARALNILFQANSHEMVSHFGEFESGSISNLEDLNTYVTEQVTLLNEEPVLIINNMRERFGQELSGGRTGVTRQEVLNWIHTFYGARNSANLVPEEKKEDKIITEIRTEREPLFEQRRTALATKRLADGTAVKITEPDMLASYQYWQQREMSDQDFRKHLGKGDQLICPFAEDSEPCLVPSAVALEFIAKQISGFSKNHLKPEEQASLEEDYVESQDLVKIIERLDNSVAKIGKTDLQPAVGGGAAVPKNKRRRLE
jgi:ankyrin repeat protein